MTVPLLSFLPALAAPAIRAAGSITDNILRQRFKNNLIHLIAFVHMTKLILVSPLIVYCLPHMTIPLPMLGLLALGAFMIFACAYPYLLALKHTDTSIVSALFSLGKITVPIMAAIFLQERLSLIQYAGFILIVSASIMLTFNPKKFQINKSLLYMIPTSLLISCHAIIGKYVLMQGIAWEISMCWQAIFIGLISLGFMVITPRKTYSLLKESTVSTRKLLLLAGLFSIAANASFVFALSLLPASIVKALESVQPLFVDLYARIFGKKHPALFKEKSTDLSAAMKYAGLTIMIAGTIMTVI